jgi:hypothetical protein
MSDSKHPANVLTILTYAGAAPFVVSLLMMWLGLSLWFIPADKLFLSYSAVINAFMAGSMWGRLLREKSSANQTIIAVVSNILALVGWAAMGVVSGVHASVMLMVSYLLILLVDTLNRHELPEYYLPLRIKVTLVVVLLHGLFGWTV